MSSNMKENIDEIRNIENKYGLMPFGMGLTHLVDVGHYNLTDSYIEESIRQITAEGDTNEANGVTTVMSPEYQCAIIRCAAELARFSIWTLFAYIKKYMEVGSA